MGTLELSRKERSRLEVFARVRDGEVSVAKAAGLLGLSLRQARRAWKRYRDRGDGGLVHGLRGKASNRKTDDATRAAVLRLYREKYADFGPTLAAEKLAGDGHAVGAETLRLWLKADGLWAGRRHRERHRRRRERRACPGELVQMDGSDHDWFEGRGPRCALMVVIDDATGWVFCRFYAAETTAAAFDVFGAYCRARGVPRAVYVDRAGIYRSDRQATVQEELRAAPPVTQFGRAMRLLAVELILANSPQAKGRVERVNGTLQDRLVKEMRLAGVSDVAAANAFLAGTFLPAFNKRFAVPARDPADVHVPLSKALGVIGKGGPAGRGAVLGGGAGGAERLVRVLAESRLPAERAARGAGAGRAGGDGAGEAGRVGAGAQQRAQAALGGIARTAAAGGGREEAGQEQQAVRAAPGPPVEPAPRGTGRVADGSPARAAGPKPGRGVTLLLWPAGVTVLLWYDSRRYGAEPPEAHRPA